MKDDIAHVEYVKANPKPKQTEKAKLVATLKERMRRLDVVYMAGNKSDEDYLKEQKEIKLALHKAEADLICEQGIDRDVTNLKELLQTDFKSLYKTLDDEEKRRFWRELIQEIKVEGNTVVSVVFH
jgi:hypothetical protein